MGGSNKVSYHGREKSVDNEGYLTGEARVVVETVAVVVSEGMATMTAAAGVAAGVAASVVVVAAEPVVAVGEVADNIT